MRRWIALLALVLTACPPAPVVPPGPEPVDASTCATPAECACETLAGLECAEGMHADCVGSIEAMLTSRLTYVDVECIAAAPSKQSVRACAGIGAAGCP